jgi:FtsH-binding integral membrane protein
MSEDQLREQQSMGPVWGVVGFAIASAGGALIYHWIHVNQLGHTSLMFIGIPAVLAIALAFTPRPKSASGGIMKGITLALLIVAQLSTGSVEVAASRSVAAYLFCCRCRLKALRRNSRSTASKRLK